MSFILLYVTYPNKEEAKKICESLLNKKLIACVHYFPIESSYWWENKIESSNEIVSLIKIKKENAKIVEVEIKKMHTYKVPCIIKIKAEANKEYENWINEVTK